MPRKIIFVGHCSLDIVLDGMHPVAAEASSLMLDAARRLALAGLDVHFTGEAAADRAGDFIVDSLAKAGVDTSLIDRPTECATTLRLIDQNRPGECQSVYTRTSRERVSFGWPSASPSDIVVFGGYFALDTRTCADVAEFIATAAERGMIVVGIPGYEPQLEPAITHVMPTLLDGLDRTDIVFAADGDLGHIWRSRQPLTPEECFRRNISFYADAMVNVDSATGVVTQCDRQQCTRMQAQPSRTLAGAALAGLLAAIARDPRPDRQTILTQLPSWQPIL